MKRFAKWPVMALVVLLFGSCTHQVVSDYDRRADFTIYTTFDVCQSDAEDVDRRFPLFDNAENRLYLVECIEKEFTDRGYTQQDMGADLLVNFDVALDQETELVNECTRDMDNYWPECKLKQYHYTYGTLVLQLTDNESGNIIWEGWVSEMLVGEPDKDINFQKVIKQAVKVIMKEYPFKAAKPTTA